jgi:hypothetical protein
MWFCKAPPPKVYYMPFETTFIFLVSLLTLYLVTRIWSNKTSTFQTHQTAIYYGLKGWQCITTRTIWRHSFLWKQHMISCYKHKCTFNCVHRKSTMFSAPIFICVQAYMYRCTNMHEHTHIFYLVSWWYSEHSKSQLCSWRNKFNFWYPSYLQILVMTSSLMMVCNRF